ncbi:hypothetical protein DICVIV_01938 [Dictyocaulus viviparus]|uniref:Uncharacterized protein n=1 Tax=Dictyocaulus viviparus TaxID=29172 RepID=A0A0D8Y7B3_DICVI|nr:hypothetical protein DICVIV_01938 [Dictyocaulus viviparus]
MENVARPNISITRDYSPRPLISPVQSNSTTTNATEQAYQSTSSTNGTPVVISGGVSGMSVTALQQQPMQIYVDPASKQHYMAIETDQGMQLYPIQIQTDGPVAYSFAPDITSAMATNGGANQTFIMMATGEVEEGSSETLCTMPTARVQTSPSRSNISTRSQKNNELNSRQPQRNISAHTTTYVALAGQETHVQTRSSQKREGAGGKGNKEKVLSTKRPRHS